MEVLLTWTNDNEYQQDGHKLQEQSTTISIMSNSLKKSGVKIITSRKQNLYQGLPGLKETFT